MTSQWIKWSYFFLFLTISLSINVKSYEIGVGIADVTGPVVGVTFMAYAANDQEGTGLHLRTFARSFIIDDGKERFVFVAVECAIIGHDLKVAVIEKLKNKFENKYTMENVMISATHTHSAPGGYNFYFLFDASIGGYKKKSFDALVNGISKSIERAHNSIVPGKIFLDFGYVHGASINRSPTAYLNNPESERKLFKSDVDEKMTQIKFFAKEGNRPMGVINWFAVHSTSMNNTNTLVSSDNFGYASILFEKTMNKDALVGQGNFVAAFSSSNSGDVSPNTKGPRCQFSGNKCSIEDSCPENEGQCIASGPGRDMFESTSIIAHKIYNESIRIWRKKSSKELTGRIRLIHQFVNMPGQKVEFFNKIMNKTIEVETCQPALGKSFAAGTTDGPGINDFRGNSSKPFYKVLIDLINDPITDEDIKCHGAKPITLTTKGIAPVLNLPYQPKVVSNHLAMIGDFIIVGIPGEFSTMSGRRMRKIIETTVEKITKVQPIVVIAGLCNTYSDYVTTPEEYEIQRYEGASTIFGPHTLTVYLKNYEKLASAALRGEVIESKVFPPILYIDSFKLDYSAVISLKSSNGLISAFSKILPEASESSGDSWFGECIKQPDKIHYPGDIVSAIFVAGDPNNIFIDESPFTTYLTIERLYKKTWVIVATDANWETRFKWNTNSLPNEAEIIWEIPEDVKPGIYRITHQGLYRDGFFPIDYEYYNGSTNTFKVEKKPPCKRIITPSGPITFLSLP